MFTSLDVTAVLRGLRRSPTFLATTAFTLALGIGATTAIFSVVNAVLLRPLPYADAGRLVALRHTLLGIGIPDAAQSLGTFYHYRHTSHSLASIAGYVPTSVNLTDADANPDARAERVSAADISANMLPTLGVVPAKGRAFVPADEGKQSAHVALISDDLWHRAFGADAKILERTVRINGTSYQIAGVMPAGFHFPNPTTELWRPLQLDSLTPHAGGFGMGAIARLAPGATPAFAQAELNRLLARLGDSYPDLYPGLPTGAFLRQSQAHSVVRTMRDDVVGDFGRALWVVAATVALLLVVTCANVANLLLLRAQRRAHEIGVRAALGASRGRLLAPVIAEAAVLALVGGVAGVGLAFGAIRLLVRAAPPSVPRVGEIGVDAPTLGFTLLTMVVVTLACAVLPALRSMSAAFGPILREGGRSGTLGKESHRMQSALIAVQVALAVVLLAGSGLLARTVERLNAVRPGFDPTSTLTFTLSLPVTQYPHLVDVTRYYDAVVHRIRALPGVEDVGVVSKLPLVGGEPLSPVYVDGVSVKAGGLPPVFPTPSANADYFKAMRIGLVSGRLFLDPNDPSGARDIIVSRAFADLYWPDATGRAALGHRIRFSEQVPWSTIVGVVESVRDTSLEASPIGEIYFPLTVPPPQTPDSLAPFTARVMSAVVRVNGDPSALAPGVRATLRELDPSIPMYDVLPMAEILARASARTRFVLAALAAAAVITLLLGAIGMYGVIAYAVSLRTRELGLRLALGAQPSSVLALVLGEGLRLTVIGAAAGLATFMLLGQLLRGLLFQVAPTDPLTLAAVIAALFLAAALATWIPARRAARIDPVEALRL